MSSYYSSDYPPLDADAEQTAEDGAPVTDENAYPPLGTAEDADAECADADQTYASQYPAMGDGAEQEHYATMGGAHCEQVPDYAAGDEQQPLHMGLPTGDEEEQEAEPAYGGGDEDTQQLSYADALGAEGDGDCGEEPAPEEEQAYAAQHAYGAADDSAADVDAALEAAGDDICAAAAQLWELDVNRLTPGTDYTVSTEGATERYGGDGEAEPCELGPYVTSIEDSVWERETYSLLKALLDNYSAETGVPERVSSEERAEEAAFIAAVTATPVMRLARGWLAAHAPDDATRESCADEEAFAALAHDLWFGLYGRDGRRDSSGFEHVFCGELDDGRVKGLHNFVQVVVEESRGNLVFRGCVGSADGDADAQVATIRFDWMGLQKRASSMFVGVSPEFEVALYTLWWLGGGGGDEVQLGAYSVRVKMHELRGKLGAAYPEVLDIDYDELDSTW